MKYRALVSVHIEVEADDPIQAEEDAAVALIHMVRNDEVAFNIHPLGAAHGEGEK